MYVYVYICTYNKAHILPDPSNGSPSTYMNLATKAPMTSPPKALTGCVVIFKCATHASLGPHRAMDPRAPGHDDNGAEGPAAKGVVVPGVSPGEEKLNTA